MEKRLNIEHILIQATYYVVAALTFAFGTYTMLSRGVSSSTIGVLLALSELLAILLQFVMSNIIDKYDNINSLQMSLILSIVLLLVNILNYLLNAPSTLLCITYVFYQAFVSALMPLFNQLSASFKNAGYNINFGVARASGSMSYAITCFFYGYISEAFGYKSITLSLIFFQCLLIFIIFISNKDFVHTSNKVKQENISYKELLFKHKEFVAVCLGYAFLMCGYKATENFILPIVENCGGTNKDSGIIQGIKAVFEIPIIYYFSEIEKRLKLKTIFCIAGISFTIKMLVMCLATSTLPIYLSQVLQMTSFAFLLPATVSYIGKTMSQKELARGHGFQSLLQTLLAMLYSSISGNIIDTSGIKTMCLVSTIITFAGFLIMFFALKNEKE